MAQYFRRYSERFLHFEESHPYKKDEKTNVDSLKENSTADSFIMLANTSIFKIATMKKEVKLLLPRNFVKRMTKMDQG